MNKHDDVQEGLYSGATAAAITFVISFAAFLLTGSSIERTLVWMLALGLLAFGGTHMGVWLGHMASRRT